MKSEISAIRYLLPASILFFGISFASATFAASISCTVNTTDPDAYATVTFGTALIDSCGLGDNNNVDATSTILTDGGWSFFGKKDAKDGDKGTLTGWTVTGYTDETEGTWEIDADSFADNTEFLLVIKDGTNANPAGTTPDTKWVWFSITSFLGESGGDWFMWGNGNNRMESSHMNLYTRLGDLPVECPEGWSGSPPNCIPPTVPPDAVPEPGVLFLMGAGLLGLGMARRRKSA